VALTKNETQEGRRKELWFKRGEEERILKQKRIVEFGGKDRFGIRGGGQVAGGGK